MVKYHSAVIFVTDIERSKQFYKGLLGFEIEHDFGTNIIFKGGLSIWQINQDHVIARSEMTQKAVGTRFELCFETENMGSFLLLLEKVKPKMLHQMIEEPWGQMTLRFYDPDGHLIEVGESLDSFVYRFYKQGMTIEQVASRTSVSKEYIVHVIDRFEK